MENALQSTETKYFLDKKFEIRPILALPEKVFLQKTYEFEKLKELKKNPNFVFLITGWITHTAAIMQIKNPTDSFIKQDIIDMLGGFWSNLSFEELIKAFEMERYAKFEERTEHYQLFDAIYIARILKKYNNWKSLKKIELKISNPKIMNENILTDEDKEIKIINGINSKYQEFIDTKEISEPFAWIFKELCERGFIKIPNENTPKMYVYYQNKLEEARVQIISELENFKSSDKNKRLQNKEILQSIISNIENENGKIKIEIRAKKLVLIDFFTKQKNENKTKIL